MREIVQSLIAQATRSDQDALLLRQFVETKDQRAFRELYDRHAPSVLALISRMLKPHQPDDVFQEVFKEFAEQASQIINQKNVLGWLLATARNKANQELRRKYFHSRFYRMTAGKHEELFVCPGGADEVTQVAERLNRCLENLSEESRKLISSVLEGKTLRQISAETGLHFTTIKKRKDKAIAKIICLMKIQGD